MMVKEFLQLRGLRKFEENYWVLPCGKRTFVEAGEVPIAALGFGCSSESAALGASGSLYWGTQQEQRGLL